MLTGYGFQRANIARLWNNVTVSQQGIGSGRSDERWSGIADRTIWPMWLRPKRSPAGPGAMTGGLRRRNRLVPVVLIVVAVCAAGTAAGLSFAASPSPILTTIGGSGAGQGTTVAQNPVSLATTPSGGLQIGDGTLMVVRGLTSSGREASVACSGDIATSGYGGDGGPAADASCDGPYGLAVDGGGNLYIADNQNNRIRVVATTTGTLLGTPVTAGQITTVAGDGTWGYAGNAGAATNAQLAYPAGIALDGSGNLVICDSGNNVVRVVAATTGSFYGQSMTAGDIYTVAGDGTAGRCRRRHQRRRRRARPAHGRCRRRPRQPGHRRPRQQPDPGGGRQPPVPSTGSR